jgi:hypothetical protein
MIVRHLEKFSSQPLYCRMMEDDDKSIQEVTRVQTGTKGLRVKVKFGPWIEVTENNVYNDLTKDEFYPKLKKVKETKNEKSIRSEVRSQGKVRVWL